MAQDAVLKVKETEDKGAELIKAAAEKAKAIIEAARKESGEKQSAIVAEANKAKNETVRKACEKAHAECEPVVAKGEADIAKILNPPTDKLEKVVSMVVERIVNLNGNS